MKGSGTVGQFEQLDQLLETQDGMLRTAQVVSAGISKPVFYDYVHSRELEREGLDAIIQ